MAMSTSPQAPTSVGRRGEDPAHFLPWLREHNPFFASMDDRVARQLFSFAEVRLEQRGKVLQQQDQRPLHVYVVIEGTLVLRVVRNKILRELFSYGPGDFANLLALIDQQPSPYEVVAVTNAQFVAFDVVRLAMFTACYHPLSMSLHEALTPALVNHLRDLHQRVVKLAQRKNASVAGTGQTFRRDELNK
jgi:CRP-like cAMP-binding protein